MDYKSNWLGNSLPDYETKRLEQAMRDHNYGLQYWLYTLVLHRYLQSAMEGDGQGRPDGAGARGGGGYDYATHFGGVMYLFVRGMEPTVAGSGVYFVLPDRATLERLDRCLATGRADALPGTGDPGTSLPGGSENG